jgi:hypothetical protein
MVKILKLYASALTLICFLRNEALFLKLRLFKRHKSGQIQSTGGFIEFQMQTLDPQFNVSRNPSVLENR